MLINELKSIVRENKKDKRIFLRNLLKEQLQYYVLDFIYSSDWGSRFLFKGGTCLRFCFDLPRLSEDLDFDIQDYDNFDLGEFCQSLEDHFTKHLQIKRFSLKVAGNNRQIFLRFPIMEELGLRDNAAQTDILFLRLDVQGVDSDIYEEEVSLISEGNFNFIIRRYSLGDLFSSKIAAILNRSFKKGKNNQITFKGRDYFDLIWFLERGVEPNFKRLGDITGFDKSTISKELDKKVEAINIKYLKEDLQPLFASQKFVTEFCDNFKKLYEKHRCSKCGAMFAYWQASDGVGAVDEVYRCSVCGEISEEAKGK